MKPVNIYSLSRISDPEAAVRLDLQMSKRAGKLSVREQELEGVRALADQLIIQLQSMELMDFYYSFQLPKLGKEFDLLRISEDFVLNVELKSRHISDESIKKQLLLNRYYLSVLGKRIRSYTYISDENRLFRLTGSGHLKEVLLEELCEDLKKQTGLYQGDIEELFKEEQYLVSPLTDPERFLRHEYFLTSQQWDIKRRVLYNLNEEHVSFQGFAGLPGTGKTILLYDIAMELSRKQKVCIIQCSPFGDERKQLNSRLKKIDFYCISEMEKLPEDEKYAAILIDEGHALSQEELDTLTDYASRTNTPVIMTYDSEDVISEKERKKDIVADILKLPDYREYRLTNRIRINKELSMFINNIMHIRGMKKRQMFPAVALSYASCEKEAEYLLDYYQKKSYINPASVAGVNLPNEMKPAADGRGALETGKEYEKVVMRIDDNVYYDENGYLRTKENSDQQGSAVRQLFHGLNRASKELALIIVGNDAVFEQILSVLVPAQKTVNE